MSLSVLLLRTHLADDEHVLPPDDALLDLGAQSFADVHLVLVGERRVYVTVTSCYGRLHRALDHGLRQMRRLGQKEDEG